MKYVSIFAVLFSVGIVSCNSNEKVKENNSAGNSVATTVIPTAPGVSEKTFISEILKNYFSLKNALINNDGNQAATAAKQLLGSLATTNDSDWKDISSDIKENAEHISENGNKIAHQREHFVILSQDIIDLVKKSGANGDTLYVDHCPMADENKGALWLSEFKEIKNPFLSSDMKTCGTVKEVIK